MEQSRDKTYLLEKAFLFSLITALCAILVQRFFPAGTDGNLEKARELGIVSITVLTGYSKSGETFTYLFSLIFIFALSLIGGIIAGKRKETSKCEISFCEIKNLPNTFEIFLFISAALIFTYYSNFFFSNWLDHYVFYSEEGQHLSYVANLFHGKELYRDTYAIYGPLMEYPIYWLMRLLGKNVVVFRLFTYLLNLCAYTVVYILLRQICRRALTAICGIFTFVVIYFPVFSAPNGSHMRTACGLIPLIFLSSYLKNGQKRAIFLAGISSAGAFFFSPEVGVASSLAALFVILAGDFTKGAFSFGNAGKSFSAFAGGFLLVLCAVFGFLLSKGALSHYLNETFSYPYYVTLGFGNLPFPGITKSVFNILADLSKDSLARFLTIFCFYWPIVLYFILLCFFILNFFISKEKGKIILLAGITIYGMILFRGALSRSGIDRNYLLVQPALILSFYMLEENITKLSKGKTGLRNKAIYLVFSLFLGAGIFLYGAIPGKLAVKTSLKSVSSKFLKGSLTVSSPPMKRISTKNSGMISIPSEDAERIMAINEFLTPYLNKGEIFYVFPNDAVYYFLFDTPMPVPFGVTHDAATQDLKMSVLKSLKKEKPRFILNTAGLYQVDLIPEEMEFPLIKKYIDQNYYLIKEFGEVKILEAKHFLNDDKIL